MNLLKTRGGVWAAFVLRLRAAHLVPAGAALLAALSTQGVAHAQGTAVLTGQITDAQTKKPLGDVVVTATSPALQGEQTVVTDASGTYRIPNLPPGPYTLRLERDAYRPYSRGGITMRVNSTIRVNAELLPENVTLKEEVTVVGKAPTVDVGSSSTGVTINQDFASRIALNPPGAKGSAARSFENVAAAAPQVLGDDYGYGVNGTTSPENGFQIDGVSVSNPAYGVLGTPLSMEFIKEVNVITGGYLPEFGRAMGGIMDVTTKFGSNEFHGSAFFNITPGALEGPREIVRRSGTVIQTNPSLSSLRDFGADIGGPIVKDKLWFYVGVDFAFSRYKLQRSLNQLVLDDAGNVVTDEFGFEKATPIPGTTRDYYADQRQIQYIAKLTYAINQNNNLTLSVYGAPTRSGGDGNFGFDQRGAPEIGNIIGTYGSLAHRYVADANDVSLKYSSALYNKRLLFDVTLGWHHENTGILPPDGSELGSRKGLAGVASVLYRRSPNYHPITDFESVPAGYCQPKTVPAPTEDDPNATTTVTPCPAQNYFLGGPDYTDDSSLNRYQAKAIVTGLVTGAGHHVIKGGVDFEMMTYDHTKAYSGRNRFRENLSGSGFLDHRQYGYLTGPDEATIMDKVTINSKSLQVGSFVQDSWQIMDKVTLNAGLRWDSQFLYGADGTVGISLPHQWSPRVGVIYDFTQQGRSKIFANYARYYESIPLDVADRALSGEPQASSFHRAKSPTNPDGCDPRTEPDSEGCRGESQRLPINATFDPNAKWFTTGADKTPIDPDLKPQSSDEVVVGGEYEIFADARIGVQYTKRWLNHAIEDMSRDEANTYFISNPGYGIAKDFPKATRDYDAGTVFFQKVFSNTWLAQASYTISYLRGNYAGLYRPETLQLDPNINSDFDLRSLVVNRTGPLPGDSTHSIKLYGAKDFQLPGGMDIQLGLAFRTRSGSPISFLGSHPIYGSDEVFILPRGAGGRTPWVHNFDAHLGYAVRITKDSVATVSMDIFNLFNFQGATAVDQTYTSGDVIPIADGTEADLKKLKNIDGTDFDPKTKNPNFKNPTSYQAPRQFRFGAKVTF